MIVRAAPAEHYGWIISRTHCAATEGFRAIEVIDARGRIHGMIGYDLWTENAVQMHIALDEPASLRPLLKAAFRYPFVQSGKGIAIGIIPERNLRSRVVAEKVGFVETHRIADGWAKGEDLVIYELRRENCRWLLSEERHGQERTAAA